MITYRYDAYGNTTRSNNTLNNPYQYNAEYTDSSTGLQYLRARYYDSSQGRFTTKDTLLGSIEKPITRNLYTYCGNNPLNITDPSGHSWISRAWNGVKSAAKTAGNWANKHIVQPVKKAANTAVNWANTHVIQPIKNRITNSAAYQKGKQYVEQAKQTYNTVTNYVSNKAQQFYNDYVPPKMQKAIEEAKRFVCTTTDRIVKDAKEFIQNVDWKKVAIGVAATAAITLAVVATGGAAAPVLIGAAVGAGISTGTTVVSGVIQGKSPAEIAKDASGAFMWGAIGGAVGGGTTQLLGKVGTKVIGKVGKKVIEDGVDMALDLAQTASENGGLTGKDILFSATTTLSGGLLSSVKTPSTVRNQLIDGVTDNKAVKNAVVDSATDNKAVKNAIADSATDSSNIKRNTKNTSKTDFFVTNDSTGIPSKNVKTNSQYDRLEVEIKSGKSVRSQNAVDDWDNFLGTNQTDIDPFTGEKSMDRIWSEDGNRSIRFGEHEMSSMGTTKFHYHKETWYDDYVVNELQRVQK